MKTTLWTSFAALSIVVLVLALLLALLIALCTTILFLGIMPLAEVAELFEFEALSIINTPLVSHHSQQ